MNSVDFLILKVLKLLISSNKTPVIERKILTEFD